MPNTIQEYLILAAMAEGLVLPIGVSGKQANLYQMKLVTKRQAMRRSCPDTSSSAQAYRPTLSFSESPPHRPMQMGCSLSLPDDVWSSF